MKWLLLIPFQLEAVKRKTASGLISWAVMFWSWELLWRCLWNFQVFCPHWIEIPCLDSSLPTGRRQVQALSDFIIFVACLVILLISMLYGHLKQQGTSLTSVPNSAASQGKLLDINIHDSFLPYIHLKETWLGKQNGSFTLYHVPHLQAGQTKVLPIPLCCISLSLCTNISDFKAREKVSLCGPRFSAT